jgi:actin-like ATPase involved in cell morphogenesis
MSHRLGIDFGTTHTVAVLETADGRAQPLLFDSSPLLSSAVYADTDGRLLTGRDGERSARLDPTRYEPNPKRRIDEAAILLGNDEFPVPRVIAAVLARVATEAVRAAGSVPAQTVLTYPAMWGPQRKDLLARAAAAAGLPSVTLVPEPVAAAAHFTGVLGRTVNPGEALAVYDFGAGTFDASLVRGRPDGGWELVASDGLADVGGLDLDAALVDRIARTVGVRDPQRWHNLVNPASAADRRASRTFWDDVRAAKEQMSRTSSAAVHVPLFDTDTHLTREEFEEAARPLLTRTVEVMAALLGRAGPTQLAGVYLVGGSSRIPVIATLLHQRLGIAPTLIDQPELLVAQGSLRAVLPPRLGAAPPPFPSPPIAPPFGAGAVSAPPFGAGAVSAPPFGAGAVSAPPFATAAMSVPPASAPVSGDAPPFGAGNTPPFGAAPVSGPPESGPTSSPPYVPAPPAPVPGMPLWGSTAAPSAPAGPPAGPPARSTRRRSGRLPWILAGAAVVLLLICGLGARQVANQFGDPENKSDDQRSGSQQGGGAGNGDAGGGTETRGPGGRQQVTVNRTVWYAGMKVTLNTATYDPQADPPVQVDITMENLAARDYGNARYTDVYLALDGQITNGQVDEVSSLPGSAKVNGRFVFEPEKPVANLRAGVVSIGDGQTVQAVVPLGDPGKTVSLEPKKVGGPTAEMRAGVFGFKVTSCEQRADYPSEHKQVAKGSYMVVCVFDVKSYKESIYDHGVWKSSLRLKLPDGTVVAPEEFNAVLLDSQQQERDVPVAFTIRWPAPGAYTFQLFDAGRLGTENQPGPGNLAEVPMTLG